MEFTDENLRWLKAKINEEGDLVFTEATAIALLARLEAAEYFISQCKACHGSILDAEEAWLKSCGKE